MFGGSGVGTEGYGSSIKGTVVKPVANDSMLELSGWDAPPRRDGQTAVVQELQANG